jgi:hypothetical protein
MEPFIVRDIMVIDHEWLEYASWIAQIIVAVIALAAAIVAGIAAFVAWQQLGEMTNYRRQRLKIANATLLMELDHRFDSGELAEARKLIMKIAEEIGVAISTARPLVNDQEKLQRIIDEWTRRLADMRANDGDKYSLLLRLGGFFETVGMMVKREYVSKDDALGLFMGPIVMFGRNFKPHIEERQKEAGVPAGMFEHALYLYELATPGASATP